MTDNATRKSFWKRNGLKFPGSVRIVPSNSSSIPGQPNNESISQEPIVIGARYNYTSLVTARHNLSTDASTPPPLLPSHYPSGKSTFSTLITSSNNNNNNNNKNNPSITTNKKNKQQQHKRHTSSTKKSFNAFLEDTNDEWNDSIEDNSQNKKMNHLPINKSSIHKNDDDIGLSKNINTTPLFKNDHQIIDSSNLPPFNKQNDTSNVTYKDNFSILNNHINQHEDTPKNNNNHDNNHDTTTTTSTITTTTNNNNNDKNVSNTNMNNNNENDINNNKDELKSPDVLNKSEQRPLKSSEYSAGVVYNIKDVLQDPTYTLWYIEPERMNDPGKSKKLKEILTSANIDLALLRNICWSGIPMQYRLMAWQLLLGYLPCNSERRVETLARKRKEYSDSVKASYSRGNAGLDQSLYHQIHIDILRTNPGVPLYQSTITQGCLERILYQWAIRHPASGYVQGINDLVTPIFEVFLSAYIDNDPENYDVSLLNQEILDVIEADSFWCLSKLLDGIQDNYTFAQPGIQRQIVTLKDLVSRIDAQLANHLQQEGVEFIQFAFRWMNCLLMRELPLKNTIRMWDTYLAEGSSEGFSEFHVYVCAAFLVKWSNQLQKMDFQEIMIFLQQLPTNNWKEKDIELLLSEAYMWKTLFHNAPNHLKNK